MDLLTSVDPAAPGSSSIESVPSTKLLPASVMTPSSSPTPAPPVDEHRPNPSKGFNSLLPPHEIRTAFLQSTMPLHLPPPPPDGERPPPPPRTDKPTSASSPDKPISILPSPKGQLWYEPAPLPTWRRPDCRDHSLSGEKRDIFVDLPRHAGRPHALTFELTVNGYKEWKEYGRQGRAEAAGSTSEKSAPIRLPEIVVSSSKTASTIVQLRVGASSSGELGGAGSGSTASDPGQNRTCGTLEGPKGVENSGMGAELLDEVEVELEELEDGEIVEEGGVGTRVGAEGPLSTRPVGIGGGLSVAHATTLKMTSSDTVSLDAPSPLERCLSITSSSYGSLLTPVGLSPSIRSHSSSSSYGTALSTATTDDASSLYGSALDLTSAVAPYTSTSCSTNPISTSSHPSPNKKLKYTGTGANAIQVDKAGKFGRVKSVLKDVGGLFSTIVSKGKAVIPSSSATGKTPNKRVREPTADSTNSASTPSEFLAPPRPPTHTTSSVHLPHLLRQPRLSAGKPARGFPGQLVEPDAYFTGRPRCKTPIPLDNGLDLHTITMVVPFPEGARTSSVYFCIGLLGAPSPKVASLPFSYVDGGHEGHIEILDQHVRYCSTEELRAGARDTVALAKRQGTYLDLAEVDFLLWEVDGKAPFLRTDALAERKVYLAVRALEETLLAFDAQEDYLARGTVIMDQGILEVFPTIRPSQKSSIKVKETLGDAHTAVTWATLRLLREIDTLLVGKVKASQGEVRGRVEQMKAELEMIGRNSSIRKNMQRNGSSSKVRIAELGQLSELNAVKKRCDLLAYTTYRDEPPGAALKAMSDRYEVLVRWIALSSVGAIELKPLEWRFDDMALALCSDLNVDLPHALPGTVGSLLGPEAKDEVDRRELVRIMLHLAPGSRLTDMWLRLGCHPAPDASDSMNELMSVIVAFLPELGQQAWRNLICELAQLVQKPKGGKVFSNGQAFMHTQRLLEVRVVGRLLKNVPGLKTALYSASGVTSEAEMQERLFRLVGALWIMNLQNMEKFRDLGLQLLGDDELARAWHLQEQAER